MLSPVLIQFNPVIGDLAGNRARMVALLKKSAPFPLALLPELALTGYPPRDLLEAPGLAERLSIERAELARQCAAMGPVLLGDIAPTERPPGWLNAAWLLTGGNAEVVAQKQLLPNYDVFDEPRYFAPGEQLPIITIGGSRVAVTLCEDLWGGREVGEAGRYERLPADDLARSCDLLVNLSASPYHRGKPQQRFAQARAVARRASCTVAVVNAVGGQDSLIFDGHSFVCDGVGLRSLPGFVEVGASPQNQSVLGDDLDLDRAALVLGLRDYLQKTGCAEVVLGLSGGIDSALVAALACEALGADAVYGLALPSRYSSARSVVDAERLAANLGMRLEKMPIEPAHQAIEAIAAGTFSTAGVCDENIQARLRGLLVMAVANAENRYALATGNKSELAVGYCTLYGDLCGALAPIGDLFKTDVFALSERFGEAVGGPIPATTSAAPPSAELRPDQRDDDSLPPYAILDPILRALIEDGADVAALIAAGHPPEAVYDAAARLRQSEYKRWQAPPVLRLSKKAFGNGRRIPLAQRGGLQ